MILSFSFEGCFLFFFRSFYRFFYDRIRKAAALQGGQIMLLENLRFDAREEMNNPEFAKELASMAELYEAHE